MLDEKDLGRLMVAEVENGERPSTVLDVERAIATGRRQRRIGRGLMAGGVLGVVAAVTLTAPSIVDALGGPGNERSAAPPATSVVTAYSGIHDPAVDTNTDPGFDKMSPAHNYSLLLDPRTGKYDRVPYPTVVPAPDGQRVLVWQGDNSLRYPLRVGVLDRATGSVRWMADGAMPLNRLSAASDGEWSPDGRRILFTAEDGVRILDADTLAATFVAVPGLAANNARGLAAVWTPDGTGFTMPLTDGQRFPAIRTWDLTGTVRADTAVSHDGDVEAVDWSFSPDRRLLAVTHATGVTVFDTRTGAVSRTVTPSAGILVGWRDGGHLVVVTAGPELRVVSLAGAVVRTVPLSDANPQRYRIGSASGVSPKAVTF
jgi:dipeptidyl aminopeptidase/acylaminoacyl peptidase